MRNGWLLLATWFVLGQLIAAVVAGLPMGVFSAITLFMLGMAYRQSNKTEKQNVKG